MIGLGPPARFRLYTRPRDYVQMFCDLALRRGASGDDLHTLETVISDRLGVPYAMCVPQARVGIYLAVKALIKPGQKVVLSPYTIADVVNMVICAGGEPVFADIDRPTTNVTPAEIARCIDSQTGAVVVTHLHGIAADIERIAAICAAHEIPMIEDCAQAFGAQVDGKPLGSFGDAGVFSFGMYKNLTSFFGGMVVTRSPRLYEKVQTELQAMPYMPVRTLINKISQAALVDIVTWPALFRSSVYWLFRFGYLHDIESINRRAAIELDTSPKTLIPTSYLCRMRPAQARMILRQLPLVDRHAEVRIRYARMYYEGLRDLPGLIIPPFRDDGSNVYNYFPIQCPHRVELVKGLMRQRRDLGVQHLKNCASLAGLASTLWHCPNAETTAREVVLLPNYPNYGEKEVQRNIDAIRAFFRDGIEERGQIRGDGHPAHRERDGSRRAWRNVAKLPW